MKKRNIENVKTCIITGMVIFSTVIGMYILEEINRRGGISKDQKMTLISKKRKKDFNHTYYFDTDGDTNTVEAIAEPASNYQKYYEYTKKLKIGEQKSWKDWDDRMDNFYVWHRQLAR